MLDICSFCKSAIAFFKTAIALPTIITIKCDRTPYNYHVFLEYIYPILSFKSVLS